MNKVNIKIVEQVTTSTPTVKDLSWGDFFMVLNSDLGLDPTTVYRMTDEMDDDNILIIDQVDGMIYYIAKDCPIQQVHLNGNLVFNKRKPM